MAVNDIIFYKSIHIIITSIGIYIVKFKLRTQKKKNIKSETSKLSICTVILKRTINYKHHQLKNRNYSTPAAVFIYNLFDIPNQEISNRQ